MPEINSEAGCLRSYLASFMPAIRVSGSFVHIMAPAVMRSAASRIMSAVTLGMVASAIIGMSCLAPGSKCSETDKQNE